MATINAATLYDVQYSGDDGAVHAHGQITLAATSTVTAGKTESGMAPLLVLTGFYITATVGGAPVTRQLDAVILFEHRGTL